MTFHFNFCSKKKKSGFGRFLVGPVIKQTGKEVAPKCNAPVHCVKGVSVMAFVLQDDQKVTVSLQLFDKKGKKVSKSKIDGAPVWASSDDAMVTVTPSADGMSADVVAVGGPDEADPDKVTTITCTCDADLGEGVKEIVTQGDVLVVGGDVATTNLDFGKPAPQE